MGYVQKGFTLIELMIVVAIIGILAAVAIPAYQDYIARAQISEAVTILGGAKTPFSEYIADQGALPAAITEVVGTISGKYVASLTLNGNATSVYLTATMGRRCEQRHPGQDGAALQHRRREVLGLLARQRLREVPARGLPLVRLKLARRKPASRGLFSF
jgi:prepilin-type N-terminal cleavage/methylation domain-containing protein